MQNRDDSIDVVPCELPHFDPKLDFDRRIGVRKWEKKENVGGSSNFDPENLKQRPSIQLSKLPVIVKDAGKSTHSNSENAQPLKSMPKILTWQQIAS